MSHLITRDGHPYYLPFPSRQPTPPTKANDGRHQKAREEHGNGAAGIENAGALGHLILAIPRADHVLKTGIVTGLGET